MAVRAHVEWLREGVSRWNKRRKRINFAPDLSGVNFFDLLPADFRDTPKTSRTFEKIDLSDADLRGADLSNSNFQRANFERALLQNADMSLSNFDDAKFKETDLSSSNVMQSSFDGALFQEANLTNLEFEGAELSGASLVSVTMPKRNIGRVVAQGAKFYETVAAYRNSRAVLQGSSDSGSISFDTTNNRALDLKTPKNKYDVFFGTNRMPILERGALTGFNSKKSAEINYGLCEVIVPEGHKIGSLGSPLWKRLRNQKDDRLKIDNLIALDEELFFRHLVDSADKMKIEHRPTIFVHGFNNSFEAAVLRAAQIGFDLGIGQGVGLFSWPSKGKVGAKAYSSDEAAAEASKYLLADFIEKFVTNTRSSSVNVIAHSMGCRCLLGALEIFSNGRKSILKSVNQVILAAADVDTAIMPHLGKAATNYPRRTTSYVSDQDRALKVSGWLHSYPRVGFVPPTFVMSGMDTIVVNNDDLGTLSHGYVGSSRTVLSDIFDLLSKNKDPLTEVFFRSNNCWLLEDQELKGQVP